MENAAFTFEQLLYRTFQDDPEHAGAATEKAKHRVLKVRAPLCPCGTPPDPLLMFQHWWDASKRENGTGCF